jgi:hypothetical protein
VLRLLSRAFQALTGRTRRAAAEQVRPGEIPVICPRCRWLLSWNNPVRVREEWYLFCPVCHWSEPYDDWQAGRRSRSQPPTAASRRGGAG